MLSQMSALGVILWYQAVLHRFTRHRAAIKGAREQLSDEENTFVWLRYDKEKTHDEIMQAFEDQGQPCSRAQYFRFRKDIIGKVARYVGLV